MQVQILLEVVFEFGDSRLLDMENCNMR